jgi:hypothetical protein
MSAMAEKLPLSLGQVGTVIAWTSAACLTVAAWAFIFFAHSADIAVAQKNTDTQIQIITQTHNNDVISLKQVIESQIRTLRVERAEDEVFKLDMKKQATGNLSPEDTAMRERFIRRLRITELEQKIIK